jgi:hypothetical protein
VRLAKLAAVLLLVVVFHAGPVPRVAASEVAEVAPTPAPGEGAGADVRIDGDTLVIVLPMTVLIRLGLLDSSVQQDLHDRLDAAAAYWNEGLARYPYFECFRIRVEVQPTFIHPVNRDFDSPDHVVQTYGSSHVGEMADGRQLPSVLDPTGPSDPTLDYEGPFDHPVQAFWPPWLFQDVDGLAHEMGHLFGLGDDYARDENGDTASLDGRDGTLMDQGDAIDSVLAQRVGDQIIGAGYVDQLPECWKGSGTFTSTATYPDEAASTCRDEWSMEYTFVVTADGSIDGSGVANRVAEAVCPFGTGGNQWQVVHFGVHGSRDGDTLSPALALESYEPADGVEYAGFLAAFWSNGSSEPGPPVALTVVGEAANGPADWSFQSGEPPATYATTGTLDAQCTLNCD